MRPFKAKSAVWAMVLVCTYAANVYSAEPAPDVAARILKETGVQGGLVVHVGCGNHPELTAALRLNERFVVQGLDTGAENVSKARKFIQDAGLYGPVSVIEWDGKSLPYVGNLVNLIVVSADVKEPVAEEELLRVLAPGGWAYPLHPSSLIPHPLRKPWPTDIDQWTHAMHGPGGNAVARDRVAGPPRHLQWTAGPRWSRGHGYTPSVSAWVTANGRAFAIVDENTTGADDALPPQWRLVARDAFNGTLLWKIPVPHWDGTDFLGNNRGRWSRPYNIRKRLVASRDAVYVTLGARAPVSELDAATGETRRVFAGTEHTDEIVVADQALLTSVNPDQVTPAGQGVPTPAEGKRLRAFDLANGRMEWEQGPFSALRAAEKVEPFGRFELVAGDQKTFILTEDSVLAFDLATGKPLWEQARPAASQQAVRKPKGFVFEVNLTSLVYANGVLLLAQPEPEVVGSWHIGPGRLYSFDAATGRPLWQREFGYFHSTTQPDVFVVGDLVWLQKHVPADHVKGHRVPRKVLGDFAVQAFDLRTGELRQEWETQNLFLVGHHHRCYRNHITERWLTASRRGVEFLNLETGEFEQNHWVRSGCLLGQFPANGLLCTMPHSCGCYQDALLTGFNALAPAGARTAPHKAAEPLQRGPAYAEVPQSKIPNQQSEDWPTYRHDARRSGATETAVTLPVRQAWTTAVGGRLSAPVIAEGRVLVADAESHAVYALDANDGRMLWRFTADGPVDSPPTIHEGLAIFGCADGRVYAVRASDGALAWRFDAAPGEQRLMAFGRLESVWPTPGSVLVKDGLCWFAAGRSSYLDGGIRVYALDARTGSVAREATVFDADPKTGKQPFSRHGTLMPGLKNDIPVSNGEQVLIRNRVVSDDRESASPHLFYVSGFLDDSLHNRIGAVYGVYQTAGPMTLGTNAVFGVEMYPSMSKDVLFKPGGGHYQLMRFSQVEQQNQQNRPWIRSLGVRQRPALPAKPVWKQSVPVRALALIRAADTLWLAGPPDAVEPKGGVLIAVSEETGEKLFETDLPAAPVWDGLAAANGRLFVCGANGAVTCFAGKSK